MSEVISSAKDESQGTKCLERGHRTGKKIYQYSLKLPESEKFGLTSQLRRSAVSVAANIAEGAARNSDKEFIHFLYITLGSLAELETLMIIVFETNVCLSDNSEIIRSIENVRKMNLGLIKHLKSKK